MCDVRTIEEELSFCYTVPDTVNFSFLLSINKALATLEEWCERNNMKINTSKTAFQSFSLVHKTIHPRLKYKGEALS